MSARLFCLIRLVYITGEEVLPGKFGGRSVQLPKTLFMTKIFDFLYADLWPDQKFDTLFMTVTADTQLP